MGRPSTYSPEIAEKICEQLASSDRALYRICEDEGMPSAVTVRAWLNAYPEFLTKYARAREDQAEFMAWQTVEIADFSDPEEAAKARLQIDARKWLASKLAPKRYGDRLELAGEVEVKQSWADILRSRRQKRAEQKTETKPQS